MNVNYSKDNIETTLKKDLEEILNISFQPIYSLKEEKIVAYEALSRFYSDKVAIIDTLEAIEFLEKIRKIHILDFLVLEKVKKYLKNLNIKICVNISPTTIERDDFLEKVGELKDNFENLVIEITERGSFSYTELVYKIIELKKLGIKVVMDDFPMGNSNLENLFKTHISGVKIDKEMIKYLSSDKGKIIYKSVVNLLKNIGNETTAEGIETEEDLEFIKSIDVDLVQGYYIGKPIAEEEFIKL